MVELGSDGSAAGGGRSDLSEWQRSVEDEGTRAEDIHRAPQQEDTKNDIKKTILSAGMVELVDTLDLGSNGFPCRFESCCPHQ